MPASTEGILFSSLENVERNVKSRQRSRRVTFVARTLLFVIITTLLSLYFFTPISSSHNIKLTGAYNFENEDIISLAKLERKTLILVSEKQVEDELEKSPYLESAEVLWTPTFLKVHINEIVPIARHNGDVYLSNGKTLTEYQTAYPEYQLTDYSLPIFLSDFTTLPIDGYKILLQSLKKPDKEVYNDCLFIDIRNEKSGDTNRLIFGFYFESGILDSRDNIIFTRISLYQSDFSYFLSKERYDIIKNAVEVATDKKVYQDFDNSIQYYDVRCEYNGNNNPVKISRG